MISLRNASYGYTSDGAIRAALVPTSIDIPSNRRVALFGTSQREVGILIDLITGLEKLERGYIRKSGRVSFEVGYLGGFEKSLTVAHNLKHVARLYNTRASGFIALVGHLMGDPGLLDQPFKHLSQETRRRLAIIVGYGLPFDTYVVNLGRNGARVQKRDVAVQALFEARVAASGLIVATSDTTFAMTHCEHALVHHEGRLEMYDDVAEGATKYREICRQIGQAI